MVTRRRGRDWIYKRFTALNLSQVIGFEELALFDLIAPGDVREMTTCQVLRVLLRFAFVTTNNWAMGTIMYYVAVIPEAPADPLQGIYGNAVAPDAYNELSWNNTPQMYNTRDPMYSESLIFLANDTFYGEPSDNPGFLRADIKTKRALNDGDRLCLVVEPSTVAVGGDFDVLVDSFSLVKAA